MQHLVFLLTPYNCYELRRKNRATKYSHRKVLKTHLVCLQGLKKHHFMSMWILNMTQITPLLIDLYYGIVCNGNAYMVVRVMIKLVTYKLYDVQEYYYKAKYNKCQEVNSIN